MYKGITKPMGEPDPLAKDKVQRILELGVGLAPFAFLALIILLSYFSIRASAILLLLYTIAWIIRLIGYSYRLIASHYYLRLSMLVDWQAKLNDIKSSPQIEAVEGFLAIRAQKWYAKLLSEGVSTKQRFDPELIYQAVIIAIYSEKPEVIAMTLEGVAASLYDHDKILLILAYEQRGGEEVEAMVTKFAKKYKDNFKLVRAVKHPDNINGEAKAKAGNISFAAKNLSSYCLSEGVNPEQVLVTTLDADAWPHPQYLSSLAWTYCLTLRRTQRSYQPIPVFVNNIWDAPAIVRVIASDSSFWFMIGAMQPKRLRLFSVYAQSLKTLEDVDYWNVETVVEDGHQYWRCYFRYLGDHHAVPIWLPIYQDAVLSDGYIKNLADQFRQLRRWAWGTSDTPWLLRQAWKDKKISWGSKFVNIGRQLDDYLAWSTAPIVLSIGGWLPRLLSPRGHVSTLALRLPLIISGLQLLAVVGLIVPVTVSLLHLPPRPKRYGRSKNIFMVLQWVLEPIALIFFISLASLDAHARLVLNKPLEKFHVTIKTRR